MHKLIYINVILVILSGCVNREFAETVDVLRDDSFTEGCVTDHIKAKGGLGVYGQSGEMEGFIIKLKCSPDLPDNYCLRYKNLSTGTDVQAGKGCIDKPQEVIIVEPR